MHFVYKMVPPGPTFALDMGETEAELMSKHADYWRGQLDQGKVIVFGPVMDPLACGASACSTRTTRPQLAASSSPTR